jgi:hypothetical protein
MYNLKHLIFGPNYVNIHNLYDVRGFNKRISVVVCYVVGFISLLSLQRENSRLCNGYFYRKLHCFKKIYYDKE